MIKFMLIKKRIISQKIKARDSFVSRKKLKSLSMMISSSKNKRLMRMSIFKRI
jgi:hypothetical protein